MTERNANEVLFDIGRAKSDVFKYHAMLDQDSLFTTRRFC
jgi:hypothetical protein